MISTKEEWSKIDNKKRHKIWSRALLWKAHPTSVNSEKRRLMELEMEGSLAARLSQLDKRLAEMPVPERGQRIILQDVERTRGEYPGFHTPEMQSWLSRALALFCLEHDVEYMQGLNEILAPFLFLHCVSSDSTTASEDFTTSRKGKRETRQREKTNSGVSQDAEHSVTEAPTVGGQVIEAQAAASTAEDNERQPQVQNEEENDAEIENVTKDGGGEFPYDFPVAPSSLSYLLFSRFVAMFQPCMFTKNDQQISALRCQLQLLAQLMLYHDPQLALHLEKVGMTPDHYATPWFVTLFSRTTPIKIVLTLWDRYLQEDYIPVHQFVVLAFILHNRQLLISTHEEYIPETLTRLAWVHHSEVPLVWERAQKLMEQTPASFYSALEALCYDHTTPPSVRSNILVRLESFSCVQVSASDVVDSLLSSPSQSSSQKAYVSGLKGSRVHGNTRCRFVLLDCRPETEVTVNFIKGSLHLDPKHLSSPQASPHYNGPYGVLTRIFAELNAFPDNVHFCLFGRSSQATSAAAAFTRLLLQKHFRRVGLLQGGYPALVAALESSGWLPKNGVYTLPQAVGEGVLGGPSIGVLWAPSYRQKPLDIQDTPPLLERLAVPRFVLQSSLAHCFANGFKAYTIATKELAANEPMRLTAPTKAMTKELKLTLQKLQRLREEIHHSTPMLARQLSGKNNTRIP